MAAVTWVLVDGENIDATLGGSILGRRPHSDERPRWDRLLSFVAEAWGQQARGIFFLNATTAVPMPFVQALKAMDFRVVLLSGPVEEKIVDIAVTRTLGALIDRDDDVALVSNDGDFIEPLGALIDGERRLAVVGFDEFRNIGFSQLDGIRMFDLEFDVHAFDAPLPRLRVIPIDEFDPLTVLD